MLSRAVFISSLAALSVAILAVSAEPLKGFAEESGTLTRIQRPVSDAPNSVIRSNVDQSVALPEPPLVNTEQFDIRIPRTQLPANSQQFIGKTAGGQDEYWVSWDIWRHRVADAVWAPLKAKGAIIWGMTIVEYNVTRDHHIQITSVHTPDPTGKSGKILAAAIKCLDGSKVLEFPAGSKQILHHNKNMQIGLPGPARTRYTLHVPGGSEHVINQW